MFCPQSLLQAPLGLALLSELPCSHGVTATCPNMHSCFALCLPPAAMALQGSRDQHSFALDQLPTGGSAAGGPGLHHTCTEMLLARHTGSGGAAAVSLFPRSKQRSTARRLQLGQSCLQKHLAKLVTLTRRPTPNPPAPFQEPRC